MDFIKKVKRFLSSVYSDYRPIVWSFFVLILTYVVFFGIFTNQTTSFLDSKFGGSFGISFSASLLENLFFFGVLGFITIIVPTKLSTKSPEQHEFRRRVKSIMNSPNVQDDERAFQYLLKNIADLLAYTTKLEYKVIITDHYEEQDIYRIVMERLHVITNMCIDEDAHVEKSPMVIYTDKEVNNSFGQLLYLRSLDPKNLNAAPLHSYIEARHNYQLSNNVNEISKDIDLNMDVRRGSEFVLALSFCAFSSNSDPKEDDKSWHYYKSFLYTSHSTIMIENALNSKKPLKFEVRRRNSSDDNVIPIDTGTLLFKEKWEKPLSNSLFPGDRIELFFSIDK